MISKKLLQFVILVLLGISCTVMAEPSLKNCPQNAKTMKPGPVKDAAMRLHNLYKERKEPVFFL